MDSIFNRGDTAYLLLNYTVNGEPLVKDAYQELELQINIQGQYRSIKKLLSAGDIFWDENYTYKDDQGQEQTFTGYITTLNQEDTFAVSNGTSEIQLRVMVNNEVGSSPIEKLMIGNALSSRVLT